VRDGLPVVYVNLVGGQDELVFDGQSFVMDADGAHRHCARRPSTRACSSSTFARWRGAGRWRVAARAPDAASTSSESAATARWCSACATTSNKHGFPGVVIGLSGGVDSALTLAIAVDALGAGSRARGHDALALHRRHERRDAAEQARALGVHYSVIPIEGMFEATLEALADEFAGRRPTPPRRTSSRAAAAAADGDLEQDRPHAADDRQQERDGGGLRHALRRHGRRLRADQGLQQDAGLPALRRYRNALGAVIPQRVIDRPPSAELRPDQKDSDSLPPYEVLDPILEAFIEEDLSSTRSSRAASTARPWARARPGQAQRVQAPAGAARGARQPPRLRPRLALSDHQRLPAGDH
jgi:NAD+ synthase (glutamine-hydrolysing)